jgi:hypothetical protein
VRRSLQMGFGAAGSGAAAKDCAAQQMPGIKAGLEGRQADWVLPRDLGAFVVELPANRAGALATLGAIEAGMPGVSILCYPF